MNKYQQKKEEARDEAVRWFYNITDKQLFMSEVADYEEYFKRLGKRYGLLKEFRENGII